MLDWETDYEYRFVLLNPSLPLEGRVVVGFDGCLAAIILGERFDLRRLDNAIRLGRGLGRPSFAAIG
ncbi:MAG TPA: hypothetical protein VGC49_11225 [Solirubrobacterales bacterium]